MLAALQVAHFPEGNRLKLWAQTKTGRAGPPGLLPLGRCTPLERPQSFPHVPGLQTRNWGIPRPGNSLVPGTGLSHYTPHYFPLLPQVWTFLAPFLGRRRWLTIRSSGIHNSKWHVNKEKGPCLKSQELQVLSPGPAITGLGCRIRWTQVQLQLYYAGTVQFLASHSLH